MASESKNDPAGEVELIPVISESLELKAALSTAKVMVAAIQEMLNATAAKAEKSELVHQAIVLALSDSESKLAEISAASTAALAMKTQITDIQTVIATKSDHIQNAQKHADRVRGELDRVLTSATQFSTEAEGLKARAQTAADSATELLTDIRTSKASVEIDATAIESALDIAKDSAAKAKGLADRAATIEQKVGGYETRLAELASHCAIQLQTITDLLPGATSAGLASAFDTRRQTFLNPGKRWQWIFVGSVISLVVLALTGLWQVHDISTLTFDKILLVWLSRLPIGAALVWLAMHSSRESALAKRLEEDYGYKASVAASFQGFVDQMAKIGDAAANNSPLAKLCEDTLKTIGNHPGRIYEKHQLTVSPVTAITDTAVAMSKSAN